MGNDDDTVSMNMRMNSQGGAVLDVVKCLGAEMCAKLAVSERQREVHTVNDGLRFAGENLLGRTGHRGRTVALPVRRFPQVSVAHDIIAMEEAARFVAAQFHRHAFAIPARPEAMCRKELISWHDECRRSPLSVCQR